MVRNREYNPVAILRYREYSNGLHSRKFCYGMRLVKQDVGGGGGIRRNGNCPVPNASATPRVMKF